MTKVNYKGIGPIQVDIQGELKDWLEDVGADLTGEAQRRAPKDEGTLRASGYWEVEGEMVRIVFDTPYAAVQHENIDFSHKEGEAKYLEKPLKEKQADYYASLAARLRRRLHS